VEQVPGATQPRRCTLEARATTQGHIVGEEHRQPVGPALKIQNRLQHSKLPLGQHWRPQTSLVVPSGSISLLLSSAADGHHGTQPDVDSVCVPKWAQNDSSKLAS